jgi:hypothetical protein
MRVLAAATSRYQLGKPREMTPLAETVQQVAAVLSVAPLAAAMIAVAVVTLIGLHSIWARAR